MLPLSQVAIATARRNNIRGLEVLCLHNFAAEIPAALARQGIDADANGLTVEDGRAVVSENDYSGLSIVPTEIPVFVQGTDGNRVLARIAN